MSTTNTVHGENAAADFEAFVARCVDGMRGQVRGDSDLLLALWSRRDDVAVLGAIGSYASGFEQVRTHLRGASQTLDWDELIVERVLTSVSADMGVTVVLEHMRRSSGEQPATRTLRATQAYRREDGRWRLILRHANTVTDADVERERTLLADA